MNVNRRIIAVSVALTAGLFLTGCDDPENEDTQDPAETSIQQEQDGAEQGDDEQGGDGAGVEDDEQGGDD